AIIAGAVVAALVARSAALPTVQPREATVRRLIAERWAASPDVLAVSERPECDEPLLYLLRKMEGDGLVTLQPTMCTSYALPSGSWTGPGMQVIVTAKGRREWAPYFDASARFWSLPMSTRELRAVRVHGASASYDWVVVPTPLARRLGREEMSFTSD